MKNIYTFLVLLLSICHLNAQNINCGSTEINNQLMNSSPAMMQKYQQAEQLIQNNPNANTLLQNGTYYLPVVFHVIHKGEPLGTGSNRSDAELISFLNKLNQQFAASYSGFPDTNTGGINTNIQFELAQRTINCLPTNGINRIDASGNSNYINNGVAWGSSPGISQTDLANYSFWDNREYINIWIVHDINGWVAGYASFAWGSYSFGNGIVIESSYVGNTNASVITHEMGHHLHLYHTFEGSNGTVCSQNNNCQIEGDRVCDTDPHIQNTNCTPTQLNGCTGLPYGDVIFNFMSYNCADNRFTNGQKQRMINALNNVVPSLVYSLGAQPPVFSFPTVTLLPDTIGPYCYGTPVLVNAIVTNGGSNPNYSWLLNGGGTFASGSSFYFIPNVNDSLTCTITSNSQCASSQIVMSTPLTFNVIPTSNPSIIIGPYNTNICQGDTATFSAFVQDQGNNPIFQWKVNGINVVGNNIPNFSYVPNNNDNVSCVLTSDAPCITQSGPMVTSNTVSVTTFNSITPTISIQGYSTACAGSSRTFTANITNGGAAPIYQWKVNGLNVGTNIDTFSYFPNNNDTVSCELISSWNCAVPSILTSNLIIMTVNPTLAAFISITTANDTLCVGSTATVNISTAIGGLLTTYNWLLNGSNVGGGNSYSFTPAMGDSIVCVLNSNLGCFSPSKDTSNAIVFTTLPFVTPSISIAQSKDSVCSGDSVSFQSTINYGGLLPNYEWKVNGIAVDTNASFLYYPTSDDTIFCTLTSSEECLLANGVLSNTLLVNTIDSVTATATYLSTTNPLCIGDTVTIAANLINTNSYGIIEKNWLVNAATNSNTDTLSYLINTNQNALAYVVKFNQIPFCYLDSTLNLYFDTLNANSLPVKPIVTSSGNTLTANNYTNGQVQWYETLSGIITGATNAQLSPTVNGNYYCVATINGCSSKSSDTIRFIPVGLNVYFTQQDLTFVYPNPNSNGIFFTTAKYINEKYKLYSITGAIIKSGLLEPSMELIDLSSGIYYLKIARVGKTQKILIQRR